MFFSKDEVYIYSNMLKYLVMPKPRRNNSMEMELQNYGMTFKFPKHKTSNYPNPNTQKVWYSNSKLKLEHSKNIWVFFIFQLSYWVSILIFFLILKFDAQIHTQNYFFLIILFEICKILELKLKNSNTQKIENPNPNLIFWVFLGEYVCL